MTSVSPTTIARSSLEEMLESLRLRDKKPKDLPPALPVRPTSRARLPSVRRSLPGKFSVNGDNSDTAGGSEETTTRKSPDDGSTSCSSAGAKDDTSIRSNSFGRKKVKSDQLVEDSPYNSGWEDLPGKGPTGEAVAADVRPGGGGVAAVTSTSRPPVDWDDNIGYFIQKKLRIWCRLSCGKWESGRIQSTLGENSSVQLSTGNVVKVSSDQLLPANPDILDCVDDLIQLSYLNEPSVLHNLQQRYTNDMIYSKAGPVLIAINPFKAMQMYGNNLIAAYRQKLVDSPHVYAVADAAYNEMTKDGVNQSIIISGESGAGKTETAKVAMQYLASLGGGGEGIEQVVLQTSRILESFGNAKTSRNDNSSRFGKLIEIHFSAMGKMCGAVIQTFLLEKSRVVQLAMGERSYHVFYQLCAGAPSAVREKLNIKCAGDYYYLNQSGCVEIGGVDDGQRFHELMDALDTVQISKQDQESMLSVLAAVLWLGNIKMEVIDCENHVEVVADEAVRTAAKLIGCSFQDLTLVLSTRKIKAGKDTVAKKLTLRQATDARDALAKFIYARLFDWLVDQINQSLEFGKRRTGRAISILDIYGFESFQRNSFEQLCINYANERLQQHFNRHLFKLEQEDYEADGIDWTKVDFEDNQDCLNLFEKKPLGLLSLLDEESNFPNGTDLTLAAKLKQHLGLNPCFKGGRDGKFNVRHYAGEVSYNSSGFLEKNRDPLPSESLHLLLSCGCQLLQHFVSTLPKQSRKSASSQSSSIDIQKQSVGTKFKGQLYKLMQHLESTTPHFIRCIKPNSKQLPGMFEMDLVAQQLKCCGVLEVVRIARSGYPSRITHQEFALRYGFLLSDKSVPQDPLSMSVGVLQHFNILPEMYQVGYTKLYFRTGQIGALENIRNQFLHSVVEIQKCFRGYKARSQFKELKEKAVLLQSFVRGDIARKKFASLYKKDESGSRTQKDKHKHIGYRVVEEPGNAIVQMQSVIRGWLARRQFDDNQNSEMSDAESTSDKRNEVKVPASVVQQLRRQLANAKANLGPKQDEHSKSTQKDHQASSHVLSELQRRVDKAETSLVQKEEENAALKVQLQLYEQRWSEYEVKMISMEEMWQKQIKSLQASLAAAKKTLAPQNTSSQLGQPEMITSPRSYDSEDNSPPGGQTLCLSTHFKYTSNTTAEALAGRGEANGITNTVNHLSREFEQRRLAFDEDAKTIIDMRSGMSADDELRRLKLRFDTWKKEYKSRLRDTKVTIQKVGNQEPEKRGRKWWGKLSQKMN